MTHSSEWQDTHQLDPRADQAHGGPAASAWSAARAETTGHAEFAHTEPLPRDDLDSRWWAEASDGQCSDEAAQFAASQPAPLSIV